jgi:hypothetical protein
MRQGNLGVFNLIRSSTLKLLAQLERLAGSGSTKGMPVAKQAAVCIYGAFTVKINGT